MEQKELNHQVGRIIKYRELEKIRNEIHAALKAVTEPWKDGPHGVGPFTGNTRESRQVESMFIIFTSTRGGAPGVDIKITNLHIEASGLGRALETMLNAKLAEVNAAMEKV